MRVRIVAGLCAGLVVWSVGYDVVAEASVAAPSDGDHTPPFAPVPSLTVGVTGSSVANVYVHHARPLVMNAITGDEVDAAPATNHQNAVGSAPRAEHSEPILRGVTPR